MTGCATADLWMAQPRRVESWEREQFLDVYVEDADRPVVRRRPVETIAFTANIVDISKRKEELIKQRKTITRNPLFKYMPWEQSRLEIIDAQLDEIERTEPQAKHYASIRREVFEEFKTFETKVNLHLARLEKIYRGSEKA